MAAMTGNLLIARLILVTMPMMAASDVPIASDIALGDARQSETCMKGQSSLLQVQRQTVRSRIALSKEDGLSDFNISRVNPSGAAAPLDEVGYSAVADRCCQAEMMVFIGRTAWQLGYEPCNGDDLAGMVPYHSCDSEAPVQTYAKLEADILNHAADRCSVLGLVGKCVQRPEDCPEFADSPPLPDCGCSRGEAAKFDFAASTLTANNLGGGGPLSGGAEEIRYSRIGTTKSGVVFDLVVTAVNQYESKLGLNNGIKGGFGIIGMLPAGGGSLLPPAVRAEAATFSGSTDFKFSFMSPGTNTPVVVSEVHMAIFDLDVEGFTGSTEFASSKGYRGYVTDFDPLVVASRLADGRTKFGASQAAIPNPTDPNALTSAQRRNSVMYFYKGKSSFDMTFGMEGAVASAPRNLFFSFESSLNDRCGP